MSLQIIGLLISLAGLVMFVIMFVVVIRIWNFHQEILHSGGYPTVSYTRAKQQANLILTGTPTFGNEVDEIINILSRYPDDSEAVNLIQRLNAKKDEPK